MNMSYVWNCFSQTLPSVGFANSRGTGAPSPRGTESRSVCSATWTTCSLFSPSSSERVLSPVRRKRTILKNNKTKAVQKRWMLYFRHLVVDMNRKLRTSHLWTIFGGKISKVAHAKSNDKEDNVYILVCRWVETKAFHDSDRWTTQLSNMQIIEGWLGWNHCWRLHRQTVMF